MCRTGYTGEVGYELVIPNDGAAAIFDALVGEGVQPCGLGARDTLRTEMGYPLHGQDLSLEITPVQARAGWAVGWSKPAFWGREALQAEKLILLTDVEGIKGKEGALIPTLGGGDAETLIKNGTIGEGMIPKVECCIAALRGGVKKTHIIDGRVRHATLLEIFTKEGIGTEVVRWTT